MQRTVNATKFTYVVNEITTEGIKSEIRTHIVNETDEKKALKKAVKEIGYFAPVKVEKISTLYILDDEIFFKYAIPVEDAKFDNE